MHQTPWIVTGTENENILISVYYLKSAFLVEVPDRQLREWLII